MRHAPALCLVLSICFALFLSGCSNPQQVTLLHEFPTMTVIAKAEPAPNAADPRDSSDEFLKRFDAYRQTDKAPAPAELGGYHILVVHGLLGEVGIRFTRLFDRINPSQHTIDYLKDQQIVLRDAGVSGEVLDYKSESVERCGAEVARRIMASDKPVLLITHSKGCLDTLEALLTVQREGKLDKVAGWIAIQGPFRGAPEADEIDGDQFRRIGTKIALNCLGARYVAVNDMMTSTRQRYLDAHREELERLTASVPVLCFASWKADSKPPGTDGSVPVESAILSGTDFIAVRGLSHSATVIGAHGEFDRVAFTRALLSMMVERIQQREEVGVR
ncbi:MAG TPA: hypothetical protein VKX17_06675 [Planctomycetota bacterium]|nr:hypothetical protein [Planctomycetota bacterium]